MLKQYRPQAMDTIAQNIIKKYDESLICGEPQEIPIEEIIEFHQGLILQYRNLSKNGAIHGITVFADSYLPIYDEQQKGYVAIFVKEGTILIDKRLLAKNRSGRLRFTLAHELAHYIIHQDYYRSSDELASKLSADSSAKTELQADELGAALLMPYGRLKVAHARLSHKLTKQALITQLALSFHVSVQAMEIRLRRLGLES